MLIRLSLTFDIYIFLKVIPQYLAFSIPSFCQNKLLQLNRVQVENDTITTNQYPCYFDLKIKTNMYYISFFPFHYNLPSSD